VIQLDAKLFTESVMEFHIYKKLIIRLIRRLEAPGTKLAETSCYLSGVVALVKAPIPRPTIKTI
jgi:hypothetical protein